MKFFIVFLATAISLSNCGNSTGKLRASSCEDEVKDCAKFGLLCETCSSLVTCVQNGDEWNKVPIGTCDARENCINGACTTKSNVFCDGTACLEFPCQDVGSYPDPFYCNKFWLCVRDSSAGLVAYENKCNDGWGYNVSTELCDVRLNYGQCDFDRLPLPECEEEGQSGVLNLKPEMYYVCEAYSLFDGVLYPKIRVCGNGMVFSNCECQYHTTSTSRPTTTSTSASTGSSSDSSTMSASTTIATTTTISSTMSIPTTPSGPCFPTRPTTDSSSSSTYYSTRFV